MKAGAFIAGTAIRPFHAKIMVWITIKVENRGMRMGRRRND